MQISKYNFPSEILQSKIPVLLKFYTPFCQPCKMLAPIIDEIEKEYDGKIKVGNINALENQELCSEHNVMTVPTLLFFKNGKVVKTIIGERSKKSLIGEIEDCL